MSFHRTLVIVLAMAAFLQHGCSSKPKAESGIAAVTPGVFGVGTIRTSNGTLLATLDSYAAPGKQTNGVVIEGDEGTTDAREAQQARAEAAVSLLQRAGLSASGSTNALENSRIESTSIKKREISGINFVQNCRQHAINPLVLDYLERPDTTIITGDYQVGGLVVTIATAGLDEATLRFLEGQTTGGASGNFSISKEKASYYKLEAKGVVRDLRTVSAAEFVKDLRLNEVVTAKAEHEYWSEEARIAREKEEERVRKLAKDFEAAQTECGQLRDAVARWQKKRIVVVPFHYAFNEKSRAEQLGSPERMAAGARDGRFWGRVIADPGPGGATPYRQVKNINDVNFDRIHALDIRLCDPGDDSDPRSWK